MNRLRSAPALPAVTGGGGEASAAAALSPRDGAPAHPPTAAGPARRSTGALKLGFGFCFGFGFGLGLGLCLALGLGRSGTSTFGRSLARSPGSGSSGGGDVGGGGGPCAGCRPALREPRLPLRAPPVPPPSPPEPRCPASSLRGRSIPECTSPTKPATQTRGGLATVSLGRALAGPREQTAAPRSAVLFGAAPCPGLPRPWRGVRTHAQRNPGVPSSPQ